MSSEKKDQSSPKKIAILQSNYIPWKGYFDLIAMVDEFILYDDVQYTTNDWRNRNLIKTPSGLSWLTVPVSTKGKSGQIIREAEIDLRTNWVQSHWRSLSMNYARSPFFKIIAHELEEVYFGAKYTHLSQLNRVLIEWICQYLGIKTTISNSWDYHLITGQTERLVDLCSQVKGTEYVSGPAARIYIDEQIFETKNIKLTWFDYNDYKIYPQLWGDFEHGVSILDLLFNCGPESSKYMRYV